MQQDRKA